MGLGIWGALEENKEIFKSLVKKNLLGRYKNSFLGFAWHFFTPILMLAVYYVAFTGLRPNAMDNYWVFLASALFPFNFMLINLTNGTSSISSNSSIVKKIRFPKELLPISYVVSSLIAMILGYSAILGIIICSGFTIHSSSLLLPVAIALNTVFVLGYVLLFSAVNVYVRDLQYLISATSMVFIFTTPVYFSMDSASGYLVTIFQLNPFTYYVELYHDLIYYGTIPSLYEWFYSLLIASIFIVAGALVFRALKHNFADRL